MYWPVESIKASVYTSIFIVCVFHKCTGELYIIALRRRKGVLQAHPAQQHFHTCRLTVAPWTRIKTQHSNLLPMTPSTIRTDGHQNSKVTPSASLCFEVGFICHMLNKYHG
jgi:hypothetical protein